MTLSGVNAQIPNSFDWLRLGTFGQCNRDLSVRREKALVHSGNEGPPGNWIAPPGSNRSGGGGNEAAEASGVEGR